MSDFWSLQSGVSCWKRIPQDDPESHATDSVLTASRPWFAQVRRQDEALQLQPLCLEASQTSERRLRSENHGSPSGKQNTTKCLLAEPGCSLPRVDPAAAHLRGHLWADGGSSGSEQEGNPIPALSSGYLRVH